MIREATAKVLRNGEKAQSTQGNSPYAPSLRSLRSFVANSAIGSRNSDFGLRTSDLPSLRLTPAQKCYVALSGIVTQEA